MKSAICFFLCVALLYVIQASESDLSCLTKCQLTSSYSDCLKTCSVTYVDEDQSDADWFRGRCSDKCTLVYNEESDVNTCRARCFSTDAETESDAETSSPLSGKAIWEAYAKQLFSFLKQGTDSKGLQLLRTPVPATWNTEARQLSDFCNRMTHWGIERDWNGKLFSEEYIAFLKNIKQQSSGSSTPNPELAAAVALVDELKAQLAEDKQKCQIRFDRFKKAGQTYDDFERRSCNSVELTSFDLKNAQYRVIELSGGAATNDVQEAINKFESQAGKWEFKETFINTLPAFLRKIQANTADSFNIQVSQSSSSKSNSTQEWSWEQLSKNTTKSNEFISVASGSAHTFTTSADSFKMDLTADGYTAIQVGPDSTWFSSSIVKKYQAGPFKDNAKKYFGKDGNLSIIPSTLYLLYKPTIKLYLAEADAQYLSKVKATITVGPFTIKASGISVKAADASGVSQVTLASADETPVIVALENAFLPQ